MLRKKTLFLFYCSFFTWNSIHICYINNGRSRSSATYSWKIPIVRSQINHAHWAFVCGVDCVGSIQRLPFHVCCQIPLRWLPNTENMSPISPSSAFVVKLLADTTKSTSPLLPKPRPQMSLLPTKLHPPPPSRFCPTETSNATSLVAHRPPPFPCPRHAPNTATSPYVMNVDGNDRTWEYIHGNMLL